MKMKQKKTDNYKQQLNMLSFKERTIFRITSFANQHLFFLTWSLHKILNFIINRIYVSHTITYNIERLSQYGKDSKIILASNHRSLFDNFIIITQLFNHYKSIPRRIIFPVKSNFWYDSISGLLINAMGAGMTMFPPIFRQPNKKSFNKISTNLIIEKLSGKKGQLIGIHPEGTRNKDPDLYSLLKGKPGIGEIALKSPGSIVIPIFIHNTSCSVLTEIKRNYSKKHAANISINFGHPVPLDDLSKSPLTRETIMEASNRCMQEIQKLSEEMKRIHNVTDNN
jgi:1-acyl-sn-glycerol-3-phosphate acyltransferase